MSYWQKPSKSCSRKPAEWRNRERADVDIGEHPVTGEQLTLQDWLDHGEEIEAMCAAQENFDALPKLWPDVKPRLTLAALAGEPGEEATL